MVTICYVAFLGWHGITLLTQSWKGTEVPSMSTFPDIFAQLKLFQNIANWIEIFNTSERWSCCLKRHIIKLLKLKCTESSLPLDRPQSLFESYLKKFHNQAGLANYLPAFQNPIPELPQDFSFWTKTEGSICKGMPSTENVSFSTINIILASHPHSSTTKPNNPTTLIT